MAWNRSNASSRSESALPPSRVDTRASARFSKADERAIERESYQLHRIPRDRRLRWSDRQAVVLPGGLRRVDLRQPGRGPRGAEQPVAVHPEPLHRSGDRVDAHHVLPPMGGGGDAGGAVHELLVVDRESAFADAGQLPLERAPADDRPRRQRPQGVVLEVAAKLFSREVREEELSGRPSVRKSGEAGRDLGDADAKPSLHRPQQRDLTVLPGREEAVLAGRGGELPEWIEEHVGNGGLPAEGVAQETDGRAKAIPAFGAPH